MAKREARSKIPRWAVVGKGELIPFRLRGAAPRLQIQSPHGIRIIRVQSRQNYRYGIARSTADSDSQPLGNYALHPRARVLQHTASRKAKSLIAHPGHRQRRHNCPIANPASDKVQPLHQQRRSLTNQISQGSIRPTPPQSGFHTRSATFGLHTQGLTPTPLQSGFHTRSTAFEFHTQGFTPTPLQSGFHTRSTTFGFHTHTTIVRVSHPLHCIRVSHLGFHTHTTIVRVSHSLQCLQGFTPTPLQ
ncbi:hypothetical protein CRG98_021165 [Punica granatum]|uniref:Uncharacterized protein n=1 Tax=Punica granatum TaxID=22663 RepID=A0A2I0JQ36_PUNGR|nr:hypothetical protein CRG98_021165 [Punica granatum]